MKISSLTRPAILAMHGYVPGEQPAAGQPLVKLNTNENPYPPPLVVLEAVRAAVNDALRLYPDPTSRSVREAAARAYGVDAEGVLVGNGSDDILNLALRAFVEPGEGVAVPDPTYTLYEPLTSIQGGRFITVPWELGGGLPVAGLLASGAKLIFVARPNAPTGHLFPLSQVLELCAGAAGVVLLDEAYVDFADDHGLSLLAEADNLMVSRSFSKSLSLAGMRLGLGFMSPLLTQQVNKVRDSYNLDRLAQAAAVAALDHLGAFKPTIAAIRAERRRLTDALRARGFLVPESQANFVLAKVPEGTLSGGGWLAALRERGVLVRYFGQDPRLADDLRITVGKPEQSDALLAAVDHILITG